MQLPCMFKETCMSQYCEYSVVCMSHATCIENIQNPCMSCACYMHTTCKHAWQTSQIPACYMLKTCRDLGRISTRVYYKIYNWLDRMKVQDSFKWELCLFGWNCIIELFCCLETCKMDIMITREYQVVLSRLLVAQ